MLHIIAKFTKYIVRTFLVENPDTEQKYSFATLVAMHQTILPELQKEYFCPVSGFSTKNVRTMYFVNFAMI